jgi:hypothetical protein
MGNSFNSRIKLKTTINSEKFREICTHYSKTYITYEEALEFLKEIAWSVGEGNIPDNLFYELIESVDVEEQGFLTAMQFKQLFFGSAKLLPIRWTASVQAEVHAPTILSPKKAASVPNEVPPTVQSPRKIHPVQPIPNTAASESQVPTNNNPVQSIPKTAASQPIITSVPKKIPEPSPPVESKSLSSTEVTTNEPPPVVIAALPPPPPAPMMKGYKKKLDRIVTLVPSWVFSGSISTTISIDNLVWSSAIGFQRSEGGSTGVIFVGWPEHKVAVLKGSSTVMADYFAYQIGRWCDIPLVKISLISFPSPNFHEIFKTLDELDKQKSENKRNQHSIMKEMPIIMLMEFVKGKEFSVPGVCDLLCSDNVNGQKRCYQLGRLIMFDVFINNWDRLPIIWDSKEGNIDNILFLESDQTPIIGIDQSVTCIIKENQSHYLNKIRQLLTELHTFDFGKLQNFPFATKIQEFILSHQDLKFDIGRFGLRSAWIGMMQGTIDIIKNVTADRLKTEYKNLNEQVEGVFKNMVAGKDEQSRYGLNRVDVEFLVMVLNVFKEFERKISMRLAPLEKFVQENS